MCFSWRPSYPAQGRVEAAKLLQTHNVWCFNDRPACSHRNAHESESPGNLFLQCAIVKFLVGSLLAQVHALTLKCVRGNLKHARNVLAWMYDGEKNWWRRS